MQTTSGWVKIIEYAGVKILIEKKMDDEDNFACRISAPTEFCHYDVEISSENEQDRDKFFDSDEIIISEYTNGVKKIYEMVGENND